MSKLMPDVMTFEEMDSYLRKKLARFRDSALWEDGVQEGRISLWQDLEEGTKEHSHMVFRAVLRARSLMFNPTTHPTGHQAVGNAGGSRKTVAGEALREKIRNYQTEYRQLHNAEPTGYRIAKDLGMSPANVRTQLKKMATGDTGWHHPGLPLTPDGRVDLKALKFEELKFTSSEDKSGNDLGFNEPVQEGFEDAFVATAVAIEAMSRLTDTQRELIYMLFWEDITMIGYQNLKGISESTAYRRRDEAFKILRAFYVWSDLPEAEYR